MSKCHGYGHICMLGTITHLRYMLSVTTTAGVMLTLMPPSKPSRLAAMAAAIATRSLSPCRCWKLASSPATVHVGATHARMRLQCARHPAIPAVQQLDSHAAGHPAAHPLRPQAAGASRRSHPQAPLATRTCPAAAAAPQPPGPLWA